MTAQLMRRMAPWLGAAAAYLVFLGRAIFSTQIFFARDLLRVYYPLRQYWVERVSSLEFPLWYPYDSLGQPFVHMTISGAYHPLNLLGLVLPLSEAVKWEVLLCFPAAIVGTALLGRRTGLGDGLAVLAGLLFAFSGYMLSMTNNVLYLKAAATVPWAVWAALRYFAKPSVLAALGAAAAWVLVLLAGDAQSFLMTGVAIPLAVLVVGEAPLRRGTVVAWLGLVATTFGLGALQLLPTLAIVGEAKGGALSLGEATQWSMHPLRVLELLIGPAFSTDEMQSRIELSSRLLSCDVEEYWAQSVHLGVLPVFLAVGALVRARRSTRAWGIAVAVLFVLGLALGKNAALYGAVYEVLPPWRPFRYPEKLLPFALLPFCLAAAHGLLGATAFPRDQRRFAIGLGIVALLLGTLALLEALLGRPLSELVLSLGGERPFTETTATFVHHSLITQLGLSGAVAALAALALGLVRRASALYAVTAVLALANLEVVNGPFVLLSFEEHLTTTNVFVRTLLEQPHAPKLGGFRVRPTGARFDKLDAALELTDTEGLMLAASLELRSALTALHGIETIDPYLPARSMRVAHLSSKWLNRHAGLLGARYFTFEQRVYEASGGREDLILSRHHELGLVLVENPNARPRAYLAAARCVPGPAEALDVLRSGSAALATLVPVECQPGGDPGLDRPAAPEGVAAIDEYLPERVVIRTRSEHPALLVLSDAHYSGWSATVDGREVAILPANLAVRGVPLPPGPHEVVFRYRSPAVVWGVVTSTATLAAVLLLHLARSRRRNAASS